MTATTPPASPPCSDALREAVVRTARAMNAAGVNRGRAGNVSVRCASGFLVTPSAVAYDALQAADIVELDGDGSLVSGNRPPSTEWRFHRDLYAHRPPFGAIVHAHSPFATTLACLDRGIPAFHYMVAKAGGRDIRCAPYATFGSESLSRHAVQAMEGRSACLLAHHGMIAAGATLDAALELAIEVESLAEMYWRALQVGEPALLDDAEMDRVLEQFSRYGKPVR